LVIAMMTLKALKTPGALSQGRTRLALATGAPQGYAPMLQGNDGTGAAGVGQRYAPLDFPEQSDARGRVIATVSAKPDVSARVMRAWLKES
jgi:hypothetical protein